MTKKKIYFAAFILLLLMAFFIDKSLKQKEVPQLNLSTIVLKDLNGQHINLAAFSGKPLVVNCWATSGGPCRRELPGFKAVKENILTG